MKILLLIGYIWLFFGLVRVIFVQPHSRSPLDFFFDWMMFDLLIDLATFIVELIIEIFD